MTYSDMLANRHAGPPRDSYEAKVHNVEYNNTAIEYDSHRVVHVLLPKEFLNLLKNNFLRIKTALTINYRRFVSHSSSNNI